MHLNTYRKIDISFGLFWLSQFEEIYYGKYRQKMDCNSQPVE